MKGQNGRQGHKKATARDGKGWIPDYGRIEAIPDRFGGWSYHLTGYDRRGTVRAEIHSHDPYLLRRRAMMEGFALAGQEVTR